MGSISFIPYKEKELKYFGIMSQRRRVGFKEPQRSNYTEPTWVVPASMSFLHENPIQFNGIYSCASGYQIVALVP